MTSSFRTRIASVIRITFGLILVASAAASLHAQEETASFSEFSDETQITESNFATNLGRWPGYSAYVKAGPSFSLGDGFFADDGRTGFALTAGMREPLLGASGPWFFDFGGSFMTNGGRDATRLVPGQAFSPLLIGNQPQALFSGTFFVPENADPNAGDLNNQFVVDSISSTLKELRRGSVHSAIGFYYQPISENDINLLFSFRVGGRLGHAKGLFERTVVEEFRSSIAQHLAANPGLSRDQLSIDAMNVFNDNDTYMGVFAGIESILARQEFFGGDLTFTLDVEVANDFINLSGLKRAGLPTANILFGIVARR